jgi:hypothetical protein
MGGSVLKTQFLVAIPVLEQVSVQMKQLKKVNPVKSYTKCAKMNITRMQFKTLGCWLMMEVKLGC